MHAVRLSRLKLIIGIHFGKLHTNFSVTCKCVLIPSLAWVKNAQNLPEILLKLFTYYGILFCWSIALLDFLAYLCIVKFDCFIRLFHYDSSALMYSI